MMANVDHTELLTLLDNNNTVCDAVLLLNRSIAEHTVDNPLLVILAAQRATELLHQAIKSNTAIIAQIREREFP